MSVVVGTITGPRTAKVREHHFSAKKRQIGTTTRIAAGTVAAVVAAAVGATEVCNPARRTDGRQSERGIPRRQSRQSYGQLPPVVNLTKGENKDLTLKWNIFGVSGIRLKIEPSSQQCGPGGSQGQRDVPVNGSNGSENYIYQLNANEFGFGGFKIELFINNNSGQIVGYNEKFLCVR
jgi:hypothetical protein